MAQVSVNIRIEEDVKKKLMFCLKNWDLQCLQQLIFL